MEAPARLCGGEYVSVVSTPSPYLKETSPYLKEKRQKVKTHPTTTTMGVLTILTTFTIY